MKDEVKFKVKVEFKDGRASLGIEGAIDALGALKALAKKSKTKIDDTVIGILDGMKSQLPSYSKEFDLADKMLGDDDKKEEFDEDKLDEELDI